jgi:HPt (histidine-containing phosphotransfer) domain-containing protein
MHDTPATIAALRAAAARGDLPAVQQAAHHLKGSCGTLGAVALERLCQRLEEHAQARDHATLTVTLGELDVTFAATCAALSVLLAEQSGA